MSPKIINESEEICTLCSNHIFSYVLANTILNNHKEIRFQPERKLLSMIDLISATINNELLIIGLREEIITKIRFNEYDYKSIIEKHFKRLNQIIVIRNGQIVHRSSIHFQWPQKTPNVSLVIPFSEILNILMKRVIAILTQPKHYTFALITDKELRSFYPESVYSAEDFEEIKKNLKNLVSLFFETYKIQKSDQ